MQPYRLLSAAVSLAVVLMLAGCNGAAPEHHQGAGAPVDMWGDDPLATDQPGMDQPDEDVPPATAPPGTVMPGQVATSLARWDGFGDARFGMDGDQVKAVWPGQLSGGATEGSGCYQLSPADERGAGQFVMMLEDDRFVRYSVSNDKIAAPGGGKRGMSIEQIETLYPGRVQQSDHKYVIGGHILRIEQQDGPQVLVFETDAEGIVIDWRVGLPPQVDYVEGCG